MMDVRIVQEAVKLIYRSMLEVKMFGSRFCVYLDNIITSLKYTKIMI